MKEGFQNHNFSVIGSEDIFAFGQPPLQHDSYGHVAVLDKFEDLFLINGGGFVHFRARGSDGSVTYRNFYFRM
jgi:hypothetical protein